MGRLKGWIGERKVALYMWLSLRTKIYSRFHGLIIPSSNGTAQIDHILVSRFGVFIIETKNKKGWIFGDVKAPEWHQNIWGNKYPFQNPIKQTYRHKKVLAYFLDINEDLIHTVVYFVGDSEFKTPMPDNVLQCGLATYIKSFEDEVLSCKEMKRLNRELDEHSAYSSLTLKDHIKSLEERHSSNTTCPNCGSTLELKKSTKGWSKGRHFLGCEEFPKCRFSKSA